MHYDYKCVCTKLAQYQQTNKIKTFFKDLHKRCEGMYSQIFVCTNIDCLRDFIRLSFQHHSTTREPRKSSFRNSHLYHTTNLRLCILSLIFLFFAKICCTPWLCVVSDPSGSNTWLRQLLTTIT
jgi:hypothetical protein